MIPLITRCNNCAMSSNPVNGSEYKQGKQRLVAVCEKPGYSEDLLGRPLEEAPGFYFKKLINEVGLLPYYTYGLKCFNKSIKINDEHRNICFKTWLEKEIAEFKYVLILGKETAKPFNLVKNSQKICGKSVVRSGITYWIWYGESYIFNRGKEVYKSTIELLKEIKEHVESIP